MRTNVVIDDKLMRQAMHASGLPTKRAVIEAALRLLVQVQGQSEVRRLRGKVAWKGDLEQLRDGRVR
jgi:Arc/MetJ family transcription regulator